MHKFQTGAAHVADHAGGVRLAGQDAQGGVAGFFNAGQNPQAKAGFQLHAGEEGRAVGGFAHGGGGDREDVAAVPSAEGGPEAPQGEQGGLDPIGRQSARRRQVAAEARKGLFVEDRPDGAAFQPVDHQAHGIGADVDDGGLART